MWDKVRNSRKKQERQLGRDNKQKDNSWGFSRMDERLILGLRERKWPSWYTSVDWAQACKPKGHQFDAQSGHMPGLQARSLVGGVWGNHTLMFLSRSVSLPSPLSKTK